MASLPVSGVAATGAAAVTALPGVTRGGPVWSWWLQLSWPELRHHPWRTAAAVLAIALGVALALSVQLINASALGEFAGAVRAVNGDPDVQLRAAAGNLPESVYAKIAADPLVAAASPVVEADAIALAADGTRVAVHVVGLDALVAVPLTPALAPRLRTTDSTAAEPDRMAVLDPHAVFLNAAAERRLGSRAASLRLQLDDGRTAVLAIRGTVAAGGAPLAVMDIAGAQSTFGRLGTLSRIDLRLKAGADAAGLHLPADGSVRAVSPQQAGQRVDNASRAYRVNLEVLALVALFTGAFLVYSILSLSVAQRLPQLALLGVLGLSARERLALVVAESAALGAIGSALGLALGTALALLALRLLSGDLGGGYFPGVAPQLRFSPPAALVYGGLGVLAAVAGGWLPARAAQRIAPAAALKGLGTAGDTRWRWTDAAGPSLVLASGPLALLPAVGEMPLFAYLAVACLLLGGIACVPVAVGGALRLVPAPRQALWLLAVQRARHQRQSATIAVAGVVASLALSVALTVMVASFRDSVTRWLDTILPADLYLRVATPLSSADTSAQRPPLPSALIAAARAAPQVLRAETQRVSALQLDPTRPAVALIARRLDRLAQALPWVDPPVEVPAGTVPIYVSEAMVMLYGAAPGKAFALPMPLAGAVGGPSPSGVSSRAGAAAPGAVPRFIVAGVWRDYARQQGAIVLRADDDARLSGAAPPTDLALWLRPGADAGALTAALRHVPGPPVDVAASGEIRRLSLRIFDRSFAVTYWLQAVAIAIGLFGVAASYSAQVLARRKEFGLLAHLGFSRRQVLAVVAAEGAVWTAAGAALGVVLGLGVSVVLVEVVNPQSFHWTMDLEVPWPRLALLCAAVVGAGTLTAWLAARNAAGRDVTLAVKEDW